MADLKTAAQAVVDAKRTGRSIVALSGAIRGLEDALAADTRDGVLNMDAAVTDHSSTAGLVTNSTDTADQRDTRAEAHRAECLADWRDAGLAIQHLEGINTADVTSESRRSLALEVLERITRRHQVQFGGMDRARRAQQEAQS